MERAVSNSSGRWGAAAASAVTWFLRPCELVAEIAGHRVGRHAAGSAASAGAALRRARKARTSGSSRRSRSCRTLSGVAGLAAAAACAAAGSLGLAARPRRVPAGPAPTSIAPKSCSRQGRRRHGAGTGTAANSCGILAASWAPVGLGGPAGAGLSNGMARDPALLAGAQSRCPRKSGLVNKRAVSRYADRFAFRPADSALGSRRLALPTSPDAHAGHRRSRPRPRALVPGPDPAPAAVLGRAGLRHPAALRHGGRGRDVPSGHDAALARPKTLEGGLCPALAPAQGRALWREPEPPAALLPVPGDPEALAARSAGPLPALAGRDRHRPRAARRPLRRG